MSAAICKDCGFRCELPGRIETTIFPVCPSNPKAVAQSVQCPGLADIVVLLYPKGIIAALAAYSFPATRGYYSYVTIEDIGDAVTWHTTVCKHLGLKGRVRVATEGVNVVLDGEKGAIKQYKAVVAADSRWGGGSIQFKVSGLNSGRQLDGQRFPHLSVKSCSEVVSIGLNPEDCPHTQGAVHLSPSNWHEKLLELERKPDEKVIILDTRNVYETRIGRFNCRGATTLVPPIRQFTDFPKFVENNAQQFRGKTVLMYCTGGVRCERASAYLIKKMEEFEGAEGSEGPRGRVFQLEGGICSYLTQHLGGEEGVSGGGEGEVKGAQPRVTEEEEQQRKGVGGRGGVKTFFLGKNFVFDRRRHEPLHNNMVMGRCHVCQCPHDDYDNGPECRCQQCRILLLLCDVCRASRDWPLAKSRCIETLQCGGDLCMATISHAAPEKE